MQVGCDEFCNSSALGERISRISFERVYMMFICAKWPCNPKPLICSHRTWSPPCGCC